MKHIKHHPAIVKALLTAALALTSSVSMAASTWTLNSGNGTQTPAGTSGGYGNSYSFGGLTVTAYGASTSGTPSSYSSAWVGQWSGGLGVGSRAEGGNTVTSNEHTLDNNPLNGLSDVLILKFDTAVALDKITLGYIVGDADITVMAYNGAASLGSLFNGQTSAANVTSAVNAQGGWSLIKNIGDGGSTQATETAPLERSVGNDGNVVASWWVIGAYNSGFGGTAISNSDSLADYVKVLSVATKDVNTTPPRNTVAEPVSLALAGVALLGVAGTRRRRKG